LNCCKIKTTVALVIPTPKRGFFCRYQAVNSRCRVTEFDHSEKYIISNLLNSIEENCHSSAVFKALMENLSLLKIFFQK